MVVGVAILPPSFLPSETYSFYFINRPPGPNILSPSVYFEFEFLGKPDLSSTEK
jgi:hypothetical protein